MKSLLALFLIMLLLIDFIIVFFDNFVVNVFAREPSGCNRWGICVYPDGSQICCFPEGSLTGCGNGCCDCVGPFV
jgi:hypothetical protein